MWQLEPPEAISVSTFLNAASVADALGALAGHTP